MHELTGTVAFITGGASGLGLALARVFGEQGVKVAIADVQLERLDAAVETLRSYGVTAIGVQLDVTDRTAYLRAAEAVEATLGPVQLLFNNAGIGVMGSLAESTYNDWDWILGVNLGGVVNGLCTFLPRMRARRLQAHVISTASAAGLFASTHLGVYVASKMAVVGVMEVLRAELAAESIGVSVICPHLMRTEIHEHAALRPSKYHVSGYGSAADSGSPTPQQIQLSTAVGMDPMEVAAQTLSAVRNNRLYVIPYPELEGIIRSRFDALIAALPNSEPDPARVAAEAPTLSFGPYLEALRQASRDR